MSDYKGTLEQLKTAYQELSPVGRAATMRHISDNVSSAYDQLHAFNSRKRVTVEEAVQMHGAVLESALSGLAAVLTLLAIEQEEKIND